MMSASSDAAEPTTPEDWPLRPWLLAALLGLAGLLVWAFSHQADDVAWRMAATAFVFFGGLAAAFTLDRDRWREPLAVAAVAGLVMAGLAWRAVSGGGHYADEEYGFGAGVVAIALALPLFQAGFHRARFATPYERVHYFVWTDGIGAGGALAFTGLSWALLAILSELFKLLEIRLLADLIEQEWFGWAFSGTAFGAALGVFRNQLKVLATLRSVIMLVLSILAVPLAAGLIVFLVAMIVSGPDVLWRATRSATPVLLLCAAGAWVLANAILRDDDAAMSGNRLLRVAAMALALSILPLTVFAAISMGTRIAQYGLSPERLWGLVAIAVACAYGLAWLVAVVRGWRGGWSDRLRQANLHLAVLISGIALFLALPILDFGAISARDQLARLENDDVSVAKFDFAALRWDFGDSGREALQGLAKSGNKRIAELAQIALAQDERRYYLPDEPSNKTRADFALSVQPEDPALRELVLDYLVKSPILCEPKCVALDLGVDAKDKRVVALVWGSEWRELHLPQDDSIPAPATAVDSAREIPTLKADSNVEVRAISRRYIVIDGESLNPSLDELEGVRPPR